MSPGVNYMAAELSAKRLSLLHELTPRAARIALLVNPANPIPAETMTKDTEAAAGTIGWHINVYKAESSREIEMAFDALVRDRADALVYRCRPVLEAADRDAAARAANVLDNQRLAQQWPHTLDQDTRRYVR